MPRRIYVLASSRAMLRRLSLRTAARARERRYLRLIRCLPRSGCAMPRAAAPRRDSR